MNPFRRKPAPPNPPADAEAATQRISEIAREWIEVAQTQATEIAALRTELAAAQAEIERWQQIAVFWHRAVTRQRRAELPTVLAENIVRYVHPN